MRTSVTAASETSLTTTAGAAHDLRNVLFLIQAHAERLLAELDDASPAAGDARTIHEAAARGAALARHMLDERAADVPGTVDVNDVVGAVMPLLTSLAGDRVAITAAPGPCTASVTANRVQIEQILMNLVINAREAMPDGGRIAIAVENRHVIGASAGPSRFVVISVADTGVGIDPAIQDRIFEPYFTTKAESGGTGVGLGTVRAIAALQGGHVEVSSAPGQGATFRVVLPMADGVEPRPQQAAAAPAAQPKRVLLVENERGIREYLLRCLAAEGYEVDAAASGAEARQRADASPTPIDVVVADVHLPDATGPDVARQVQARWPEAALVFMSGGLAALEDLADCGRVPVLAKPFTMSELLAAVRAALARNQAV